MHYSFYLYTNPTIRATVEIHTYLGNKVVQVRKGVLNVTPFNTVEEAFEHLYLLGYKQVR
jgi:hypothetical protein